MKFFLATCCLVVLSIASWAQSRVVTGQVLGAQKDTIIGAIIKLKGTNVATTSDYDGMFSISVSDTIATPTLIVSYVGMKEKEIVVGTQSNISVGMEDDSKLLDEVVVVGYGTIKKSDLTGAVSSLKSAEIKQVPSGNVMEGIQGKAAGVDITRSSGETGKSPDITIRGNRSINAGNGPLYIVDGVQYSSIQDINPNDIQSMEVLKDASSTAIYGSRGSNGVIIVTTKKGASGDVKVSINSYTGISTVAKFPKPMSGAEWIALRKEALRTADFDKTGVDNPVDNYSGSMGSYQSDLESGIETNYLKEVLNKGLQKDLQVAVSGGTDKMKSYFSLDYFNEKGLLKNDELKRYTGRLNVDYTVNKYVKVGTQTQITYYDQSKRINPIGSAMKLNPISKPFDDNGIVITPGAGNTSTGNPLLDQQPNMADRKLTTLRVFPTLYAEVSPIKGLVARANLTVNFDNQGDASFYAGNSFSRLNAKSQAKQLNTNTNNLNWQGILSYNKTIKKDHSINITVLNEIVTSKVTTSLAQGDNQLIPEQSYNNLGSNADNIKIASGYTKKALVSFAGRANYSYKGKYLFQATLREDGASVLAEGKKWDIFPSLSAGWNLTDEAFMKSFTGHDKIVNSIKVRGSWGIAGNASVDPYQTQSYLEKPYFVPDGLDNQTTATYFSSTIGNKNLHWEKSRTVDVGLDIGFLKERITANVDYYDTRTKDLIFARALPPSSGVSRTLENIGVTQNKGIELSISSVNVQTKKFTWSTTLTFMRNREKVLKLDGNDFVLVDNDLTDPTKGKKYVVVGSPVNSFYQYEKVGIWQQDEAEAAAAYGKKPGDIHVKDQNGDGVIDLNDKVVVGSKVPKWSAGFNSEIKYYNFDFSLYFFARVGQKLNFDGLYNPATGTTENSISNRQYWTPENPTNELPRPGRVLPAKDPDTGEFFFNTLDGSFVKLRSATLGYSLPDAWAKKIKFSRLRVYVTGKNLITLSKIKDYDPEMAGNLSFPSVRLYVAGVNLEF